METNNSLPKFHLLVIVAVVAIGTLLAWGVPQYSAAKTVAHKITKAIMHPFTPEVEPPAPPAPPVPAPRAHPLAVASQKVLVNVYRDTAANNNFNDTVKTHTKTSFKIVITDDNGNKKEYNSLEEMPEADKAEFLKENPNFGALTFKFNDSLRFANIEKFKMSPEFQKEMLDIKLQGEKMRKHFNSPEWKKQMADMQIHSKEMAEKMKKQFDSPEWKKQMKDIQVQSKKMAEQMNSPKFKKQMMEMRIQAKKMAEDVNNDPEIKKQVQEIQDKVRQEIDEARSNAEKEAKKDTVKSDGNPE